MMNKRGDIPTLMLFFCTLILCVIALFSFISFDGNFSLKSRESGFIIEDISFAEDYLINLIIDVGKKIIEQEGDKMNFSELILKYKTETMGLDCFFSKISTDDYKFEQNTEGYYFEVESIKMESGSGHNEMRRSFNLRIEFDSEGNVTKVIKEN